MDRFTYIRKANALYLKIFISVRRRRGLSPRRRQELERLADTLGSMVDNEIRKWTGSKSAAGF